MNINLLIEGLRRLRRFGFQIRIADSIKDTSYEDLKVYALEGAATVMFNVDVNAFSEGGTWHRVVKHVRQNGLEPIMGHMPERLGMTALESTAANQAIEFATLLLEQACAADS